MLYNSASTKGTNMKQEPVVRLAVNIPPQISTRLRDYSTLTGINLTRLVRDALIRHLDALENRSTNAN